MEEGRFAVYFRKLFPTFLIFFFLGLFTAIFISWSNKEFYDEYFDGKIVVVCKESEKMGNKCPPVLRRAIKKTLNWMDRQGYFPHEDTPFEVIILSLNDCWQNICSPSFGRFKKEAAGALFVPANYLSSGELLEAILAHEFTHALLSRHKSLSRVLNEFFAVHVESRYLNDPQKSAEQYLCFGKEWNQPSLAGVSGRYVYPPGKFAAAKILEYCRYGQLAYIASDMINRFPDVFGKLWTRLYKYEDGGDKGITPAMLLKWISEVDAGASRYYSNFYVLRESDFGLHAGMMRLNSDYQRVKNVKIDKNKYSFRPEVIPAGSHIFFIYKKVSAERDAYAVSGLIRISVWRNGERSGNYFALDDGLVIFRPGTIRPGDTVHIDFGEKEMNRETFFL